MQGKVFIILANWLTHFYYMKSKVALYKNRLAFWIFGISPQIISLNSSSLQPSKRANFHLLCGTIIAKFNLYGHVVYFLGEAVCWVTHTAAPEKMNNCNRLTLVMMVLERWDFELVWWQKGWWIQWNLFRTEIWITCLAGRYFFWKDILCQRIFSDSWNSHSFLPTHSWQFILFITYIYHLYYSTHVAIEIYFSVYLALFYEPT